VIPKLKVKTPSKYLQSIFPAVMNRLQNFTILNNLEKEEGGSDSQNAAWLVSSFKLLSTNFWIVIPWYKSIGVKTFI